MASATNTTVRIPINTEGQDSTFGVYAVPGLKTHVFVGPFKVSFFYHFLYISPSFLFFKLLLPTFLFLSVTPPYLSFFISLSFHTSLTLTHKSFPSSLFSLHHSLNFNNTVLFWVMRDILDILSKININMTSLFHLFVSFLSPSFSESWKNKTMFQAIGKTTDDDIVEIDVDETKPGPIPRARAPSSSSQGSSLVPPGTTKDSSQQKESCFHRLNLCRYDYLKLKLTCMN